MISYNTKDWFTFIFRFHRSDTVTKLWKIMLAIGIYSGLIGWLEVEYWQLADTSYIKNITLMHGMLGFVISLLLVFRTNTAYDRWWEGRKMWGALVNNSRNFAMKLAVMLPDEDKPFFRKMIPNYAMILHEHLTNSETAQQLFDNLDLEIDHHKHKPNQVAKLMFAKIHQIYEAKQQLTREQLVMLNAELIAFTDICGACERIKNTPIPYSYSAFLKKFIFFYVMTLPFGYAFSLGYYVVPVVIFIFYVLASLELIAEEIEDPFGGDENDLPTAKIASNIKKHVEELL